jgi:hypothetical protein
MNFELDPKVKVIHISYNSGLAQGRREGGRTGNLYRGPRLNGGPEELDYGARERQGIK